MTERSANVPAWLVDVDWLQIYSDLEFAVLMPLQPF